MPTTEFNGIELDGDGTFRLGMDSANDPNQIPQGMYCRSWNTVKRGGKVQCRPGYRQALHLPDGKVQGLTFFRSTDEVVMMVFAVAGNIFWSLPPFDRYQQVPNLSFSPTAKFVEFATATQSVQRNSDGSLTLLSTPRSILMIQDGFAAPGYFDGSESGHIRGDYTTPLGSHMVWTGDRLWVSRGRRLFASDFGNPLSFFEGEYIGSEGINSFILPGEITGLTEVSGVAEPFLLAFTDNEGVAFQSNIRSRSTWATIPNFQKTILPNVGCVAPRSIVVQYGQLWWFSAQGLTNLDVALQSFNESKFSYVDTNMVYSKRNLSEDLSGVACGTHENYLVVSVPYVDRYNRHTWVYDSSGLETNEIKQGGGWDSYWVGTRPVAWASSEIDGSGRTFYISRDRDGKNRIWEAFVTPRRDNGCPVYWGLETRGYTAQTRGLLRFRYFEVQMSEVSGTVEVSLYWAGTKRGPYKKIGTKTISAAEGSVRFDVPLDYIDDCVYGLKKQARTIRSNDSMRDDEAEEGSCSVESDLVEREDTGFQFLVVCSGEGAIDAIRFFGDKVTEARTGSCEEDESGQVRAVRFDGAGSREGTALAATDALQSQLEKFSAIRGAVFTWNGFTASAVAEVTSWISQDDAERRASCAALMRAHRQVLEEATPLIGGTAPRCPTGLMEIDE